MKILIIGGSGFLGSHIADELTFRGYEVIIFDKKKSKWLKKGQKMIRGDVTNISSLERAIKKSDVVYHMAAIADIGDAMENPIKTVKVNILGTVNALELSKKYKIKRFIFGSSIYVYSRQGGFYRSSKQAAELYVEEYSRRHNLNYTILRFGSIYGPRADVRNGLSRIIKDALKTGQVRYRGTKKAVRQFIHVKDSAKSSVNILNKKFKNQNILLIGRQSSKIKHLLLYIAKVLNLPKKMKFDRKTNHGHYDISPYNYMPKPAKKYFTNTSIDLRQGILELISEIKKK